MRFVFDSKEASAKLKGMAVSAKENASKVTGSIIKKKEQASLSTLGDDLEYLHVLTEWNVGRLSNGRPIYIPQGMSKDTEGILLQSIEELKGLPETRT